MARSAASQRIAWLVAIGLASPAAPAAAVSIDWVPVGHPGNASDVAENCLGDACGSVPVPFAISRYEITNAQYAEFLNAKAASDTLALYNVAMAASPVGGIVRSGSPGGYTYQAKPGREHEPVNFVGFYDALRFANWLHNGQGDGDTESGAYVLLGGTATPSNASAIARQPGAVVALPSENEWYKAAYYHGVAGVYRDFPVAGGAPLTCAPPRTEVGRANCGNAVGGPTPIGSYRNTASPAGTLDQGGNVWEWNEQLVPDVSRGVRGGGWDGPVGDAAASVAASAPAATEDEAIGFRVVRIPEPAGAAPLAALALAWIAARRARREADAA